MTQPTLQHSLFRIDLDAAPAAVREALGQIPEGIGTREFYRANEYLNAHVDRLVFELLGELAGGSLDGRSVADIASQIEVPVPRRRCLRWMETKLRQAGILAVDPWGRLQVVSPPAESAAAVMDLALAEIPSLEPCMDLSMVAARGLPGYLRGEVEGFDVLFSPLNVPIWQGYFHNDNPVYAANNRLVAHLAEKHLRPHGNLEWLELGGGLGSAAESVLARLGSDVGRYRFSEPFPFFLAHARRNLTEGFPDAPLDFLSVDLNEDLTSQGIEEGEPRRRRRRQRPPHRPAHAPDPRAIAPRASAGRPSAPRRVRSPPRRRGHPRRPRLPDAR